MIDGLSQIRSTLAVEALVKVLDRDPWLRFAAVHALGEIGDQRAVSALAPLIDDESVRGAVIRAMGKIGSPEALAFLFRVVRESQDTRDVRRVPAGHRRGAGVSAEPGGPAEHHRLDRARVSLGRRPAPAARAGAGVGGQRRGPGWRRTRHPPIGRDDRQGAEAASALHGAGARGPRSGACARCSNSAPSRSVTRSCRFCGTGWRRRTRRSACSRANASVRWATSPPRHRSRR